MAKFSLSLKGNKDKKIKSGLKKKKRVNAFNDEETVEHKRTKIRLTHVEQYKEAKPEKLVIQLPSNPSQSTITGQSENIQRSNLHFGLTKVEESANAATSDSSKKGKSSLNPLSLVIEEIPEETAQEEYEEVPIEEFGAALLRGMGWKEEDEDSTTNDKKKKPILPHQQPRAELVGIGATPVANNTSRNQPFLPIVKVDRKSGEKSTTNVVNKDLP
ncbi:LAFE_0F16006g1_1 [Lachancea fermentati]|uniref:Pre-mRNA-splicing factor n=1 Tax=Lachancea fermentati TaxID=4955 RepID=A0A1G4MG25_LACFM|nr:LAFE_0F16006g1_1 [Lachancea fermentati]